MRFDDSLCRTVGTELEALDDEADRILNSGSCGGRPVETSRAPGAPPRPLRVTVWSSERD